MTKTVKARLHHGADSLDITVPVDLVKKYNVNEGDIFEIKVDNDDKLILHYKRVYESE